MKMNECIVEASLFHLYMREKCSFHVGYKRVFPNVSLTRGIFFFKGETTNLCWKRELFVVVTHVPSFVTHHMNQNLLCCNPSIHPGRGPKLQTYEV